MTCAKCEGSGYVPSVQKQKRKRWVGGILEEVEYEANIAIPCDCHYQRIGESLLKKSGLPPLHKDSNFGNYHPENKWQEAARIIAWKYVDEWPLSRDKGILFWGPCGVGKTHLLVAMARELAEQKHVSCTFIDFRDFLERRRREFNTNRPDEETERILETDLLLLDELGAVRQTDWTYEVINIIINARYNRNKPLIATTNYPFSGPADEMPTDTWKPAARKETLGDRVGYRSFSRLNEICRVVEITGDDHRRNVVSIQSYRTP
jgi:DNA replication protein DnaC